MSDVQSRPARGRSTARGSRGGHGSRGPRSNKQTNGDSAADTSADQGELGELKKRFASQLSTLKELFPDWADVDLLFALHDSDGDLASTIEKITEGHVSQFAEVKKANDRSRSKVKDTTAATDSAPAARGSSTRARGGDSVRGRGRGTDRGRGGFRGSRGGAATNGTRAGGATGVTSIPTTESNAWDVPAPTEAKEDAQPKAAEAPAVKAEAPKPAAPAAPAAKTWASMFATVPKPAVPKPISKPAPPAEEPAPVPAEAPTPEATQEPVAVEAEEEPVPPVADEVVEEPPIATEDTSKLTPDKEAVAGSETDLTPSKDELTKENIEHLPDVSHGPATDTVASTVASSKDIGSLASIATPLSTGGQPLIGRPGIGGFQTTALKATSGAHRSTSFQRRLLEQQEAVVMPGNHAVNQAAVQFGSLGLNGGDLDADNLDVDDDREEAETRTQPPQHSPVAQPRAALPPAPRQAPPAESQPQDSVPTPKQAPGLPPVPQQQQPLSQQSPSNPLASQAMQNQGSQHQQPYNQFGRYGQAETAAPPQKPYDPFGQQAPHSSQYDFPAQQGHQQPAQSQIGGFSSAPEAFGSQYPTSEQQRSAAYQQYYGSYAQQGTPSQQEAGIAQQRSGSAFGAGPNDSAFPQGQSQAQSRYNDAHNSGHNTPNPTLGGQHPSGPASQQGQHMQQPHGQPGHAGNFPYTHPYYASNPYYANYASQYGGYGQGYGNFGKNMYGQSHHYGGMPPQASFDQHSSSPANVGAFGGSSVHGRESGLSGGLGGDYGRSVSGAGHNQHNATAGSGAFGGLPDSYRQPQGGYGGQTSYGQQQLGQQVPHDDSLKPFGDSKSGGPSPSALGAQPGRPGSAANNPQSQGSQGGLPQQQQGFGGYPGHLGQGNQYGGLGGLGHQGAGSHQNNFGQYGGFGGGYGSYSRGGWGTNYQQH
ncbi:hypothetical protein BU23DRAFT_564195 [Bimuria novae-zelandiae CBS 107.79]|uniref:RNA polymerase II degradation factor 1 n=1 Tax=Bimuria novae-zelandiae CBS 107.79 TaxID=1447943 RepID=A0A6A5VMY0_9PLEO|nr:hypothetical protein BU23DRAFT_564195 [Bimuria novae-zelandiae CBS 107.79]